MDPPTGIEQVVADLEPGGRIIDVGVLTGGVSANVFAVDIATSDGANRRVVCRQHPGVDVEQHGADVTAKEYRLLGVLHDSGLAVPEPYLCTEAPMAAPDSNRSTLPCSISIARWPWAGTNERRESERQRQAQPVASPNHVRPLTGLTASSVGRGLSGVGRWSSSIV